MCIGTVKCGSVHERCSLSSFPLNNCVRVCNTQGHAGYGLMYLWSSRLITGHAGAALLRSNTSVLTPSQQPPSTHLHSPTSHYDSLSLSIEFHHFIAPGGKESALLEPHLPALAPWLVCAVKRARLPLGSPTCAELSLSPEWAY